MRATTLVTAAILMSGCAQEGVQPAGAADIASPAPVAGAAGGGTPAGGPRGPSPQPTAAIVGFGARPGLPPAAGARAAGLELCDSTRNPAGGGASGGRG